MDTDEPKPKIVIDPDAAEELLELLEDRPGEADEDLLDEARDALADPTAKIPGPDQRRVAEGELVALEVGEPAAEAAIELITDDVISEPSLVRRFAQRLRGKLDSAKARRRSG